MAARLHWRNCAALFVALFMLAGCDGLFTGEQVTRFPLQQSSGGYAPVTLTLGPEMNPVALNFAAEFTINPAEAGKWNSYFATLTYKGQAIASRPFNVNNSNSPDAPTGAGSVAHTMMIVDVAETGDYELRISTSAPVNVTLAKPNLELRRNIQRTK
jgi:hypothetical protein